MRLEERSRERRLRIAAHGARSIEEAERWDLEYWQSLSPASRLSALTAIRRDIDISVDPSSGNIDEVNAALAEFESPRLLTPDNPEEIVQLGMGPDRIEVLRNLEAVSFPEVWSRRVDGAHGEVETYWIELDDLIRVKEAIDHPMHQDAAGVLRKVKKLRGQR